MSLSLSEHQEDGSLMLQSDSVIDFDELEECLLFESRLNKEANLGNQADQKQIEYLTKKAKEFEATGNRYKSKGANSVDQLGVVLKQMHFLDEQFIQENVVAKAK
jgi:hypothetical protein